MKTFTKLLALSCIAMCSACALHAQTGFTMTCSPSGGDSTLTLPITSLYLSLTETRTTSYFTVAAPIAELNLLLGDFFFFDGFDEVAQDRIVERLAGAVLQLLLDRLTCASLAASRLPWSRTTAASITSGLMD